MARALLTAVRLLESGIDPAAVDAAAELTDGNSFTWTKNAVLYILNGDDASLTVTIPTPATVGRSGLAIGDGGGAIGAGLYKLFGPFGTEFIQADGTVWVNYAGTTPTGVMVAVFDCSAAG